MTSDCWPPCSAFPWPAPSLLQQSSCVPQCVRALGSAAFQGHISQTGLRMEVYFIYTPVEKSLNEKPNVQWDSPQSDYFLKITNIMLYSIDILCPILKAVHIIY